MIICRTIWYDPAAGPPVITPALDEAAPPPWGLALTGPGNQLDAEALRSLTAPEQPRFIMARPGLLNELWTHEPARRAAANAEIVELLALAAAAGTEQVVLPARWPAGARTDDYETAFNILYDGLRCLAVEAEINAISLAVENPGPGFLASPLEVRQLIDEVNSPWIGLCLKPEALPPGQNASNWCRILGGRLKAAHLGGPDRESFHQALTIAAGTHILGIETEH